MVSQSIIFNVGGICNLVLFMGLFSMSTSAVPVDHVIPIQTPLGASIKYPINVACECMFTLYVDGVYVGEGNKKKYDPNYWPFGWNDTKKYYPVIYENQPKIVAFNGIGDEYTVLPNGFIMDMNSGNDYTKYKEWKCKDFSKTVDKSPPANWFTYEYDDSGWDVSTSYGANYQNNSYQIFENPRESISLNAEWLWTKDNSDANIYCRKKNIATSMLPSLPATTSVVHTPVSTTIHLPVRTHPQITSTVAPPPAPATTSVVHPPATTSTLHPPVSTTIHLPVRTHPHITSTVAPPPATTSMVHPSVSTTIHLPVRTHPHITSTVAPPPAPATTSVVHPPATTSTVHPPVSTTIHLPVRTHPQITSTVAPPPVSTTIHLSVRTHPQITSTVAPPPATTSVVHPPATTSMVHPPVSTTIHEHPSINIKIVINNIKYSQGVSDKQVAHLLESVKFYNHNQYRNEHNDNNDNNDNDNDNDNNDHTGHSSRLYRTVLTTRLDIIRHYQMLVRRLEHLERIEHFEHHSRDEDTNTNDYDDKLPRHSVDDSTSKNNIVQSMIKLNSRIKQIEDSIQFIKGNHKYLLLRLLRLLKQQYKKDTMQIFNI
uniref:Uncharacterized protein n=1 Tax=viral metagenome TaxID=1070528 RepID=A0A6C0EVL2_9ZZZZ